MRNIESGIAALISVALISISASEAAASQKKGRQATPAGGGQTRRRIGVAGDGTRGSALQEKMQNENRQMEPTSIEIPNLRRTRRNADAGNRRRSATSVVDRDLDQPGMNASKNEVAVESRKKTSTNTRRRSSFTPEVGDEVLLRERGQPHKQPPSRRGPHKQPPTGRGPHKI